ncbi:MAG: metallophosphoesterase, partial [Gammaproteobacteria bacterium]|nr:metallophosphoesterase [Gammaproteobacteria bacterium]
MQSIKLIHIGDIHYPQASNIGPTIDLKDEGFNSNFVSNLAPHPFLEVSKSLINCLEHQDIDGILFSGDLTSFGNDIEYKKCVDYFNQLIQSAEAKTGKSYSLHAVPGNHDLKRKNLTSGDISERFKEFEQAWIDSGHQILPTD